MPRNDKLEPKKFPMPLRFGEKPTTEFKNALNAIKVKLVQAPDYEDIKKYCIPFANATWADMPMDIMKNVKGINAVYGDLIMHHIFQKKILPTTMETIRLNFLIEGISLQEVTHILRYRRAVFSAECSGDKWLTHKGSLVPTAVENSPGYYERYMKIVNDAKKLYCDMIDTGEISVQDARTILPRNIETHYFMSMSLNDALIFIWDRIDKQIQPLTDNVLAYRMIRELLKKYPVLVKTLSVNYLTQPSKFYVQTARQYRSTNWYAPDEDSDVFEYNKDDFVYKHKRREDINGTDKHKSINNSPFHEIFDETVQFIEFTDNMVDNYFGEGFFDQDIPEDIIKEY